MTSLTKILTSGWLAPSQTCGILLMAGQDKMKLQPSISYSFLRLFGDLLTNIEWLVDELLVQTFSGKRCVKIIEDSFIYSRVPNKCPGPNNLPGWKREQKWVAVRGWIIIQGFFFCIFLVYHIGWNVCVVL